LSSEGAGPASTVRPLFFPVGMRKLALMFASTLGLYGVHWCYENWWLIKARTRASFSPKTRAFLAPVFIYGIFREIGRAAQDQRVPTAFVPAGAAVLYVCGVVATRVLADDLVVLALLLMYIPVHGAQLLANQLNSQHAPAADRNEKLSLPNKAVVAIGGALFVLTLWGAVLGVQMRLGPQNNQMQRTRPARMEPRR
jgi:hypothetical protein